MNRFRAAAALGAVLAALIVPAATGALEDAEDVQTEIGLPAPVDKEHPKLDSALSRLADSKRSPGALVQVEAVARGARRTELEAAIRVAGGTTTGRYARLIEARLPASRLEAVAGHPAARVLRSPLRPQPQVVAGQGIEATGADSWHSAQTAGAGVEIAIVDLGFRDWRQKQAQGELPGPDQVVTADFCGGDFFEGPDAEDHGTAVAEIVHELAPAAKLHLVCIDTMTSLGEAKDYVVTNDIPLVNHSVGWLNTSRGDGTGGADTPDAVVADARAQGILWINAAGNYSDAHWSGTFQDTDRDDFHNFPAPGDNGNQVLLGDGGCVYLKWDDWPTTDQDFDLYLFRTSDDELIAASATVQNGSQEPYEEFCVSDLGPSDDYYVAIRRDGATESPRFDLFVTEGQDLEYTVPNGSLIEPATSPAVVAVGAVCVHDGTLQAYSSRGPTVDNRVKPDVSAPDAGSTVTYGPSADCDSGFTGTSSSTAHATAAAALLKQANPSLGPSELQAALEGKTVDLAPAGKDNVSGAGRLALGSAPPIPPSAPASTALPAVTGLFHQGQTLTASNGAWANTPTLFAVRWLRCDPAGNGCALIVGARSATYPVALADVGHVLRIRVTAFNSGGSAQALSAGTPPIQGPIQPPAGVIPPSLAGAAQFGQSLSASAGAWSGTAPLTISLEWLRCDSAGGSCVAIAGATSSTYLLALEDIGATLRIRVTASNPAGSLSLTSAPSGVVASQAPAIAPPPGPAPPGGASPPPSPPNPPPQTTTQTRLVVVGFTRTPRTPVAGRKFALVLRLQTRALSARGAARRLSCSAKLGRKSLRATSNLRGGVARCSWTIPRTAAGKRLRGVITVSEGSRKVHRTVLATVGDPRA